MFAVLAALSLAVQSAPAPDSAPEPDPNPGPNPGLDFTEACGTIEAAIGSGTIPGAVFVVGRGADVLHRSAHGERAPGVPMTLDTVFDLASLTKSVATSSSIMVLVQEGKLRLTDRVSSIVPAFTGGGKDEVTVEQLLLHTGGLSPVNHLDDYADGPSAAVARICARELSSPPGEKFIYSDLGYILLGEIVEAVAGEPLEDFCARQVHGPLGMGETSYGPLDGDRLDRCAATSPDGTGRGVVHDPRARALGGVAGHAGVFSTAADLSRFCGMLAGAAGEGSPLEPGALAELVRPRILEGGAVARALGIDVASAYDSPRGSRFPRYASLGHTGFTGPCYWVDRSSGVWYLLLVSRLQVDPGPSMSPLRRVVADAVAAAAGVDAAPGAPHVRTGVDVLVDEDFARLKGRRLALITNVTGRCRDGRRTIDALHSADGVELVRLFSPEHGLFAKLEGDVGDGRDEATGLPVFSLYGATRRPTAEMLAGIDAVVFDIQDIGVRYYTYISTLGLAMEACGEAGVGVVVLDRPNPITGRRVEGPIIDADRQSFIGWRPLPVTHGMTVGELARMFREEWGGIECELEVVPMAGWTRDMWWEQTGVRWINPSPNMRNPDQTVLYPCTGLLEGANLSVGRGTDEPFELFGAPWIDGPRLCDALRAAALPGLEFTPIEFTPDASKFKDELCQGVHVTVTDRDALRPVASGLAIMWHLDRLFGRAFDAADGDARLRSASTWEALLLSPDWRSVPGSWAPDVEAFRRLRQPYLIYPDAR